jgi:serine/threonine protein kinase
MTTRTVGRYEILKEIGQGGQSTAYKARDPKIDRIVAIKQMRSMGRIDPSLHQEFVTRFMREAQAAGRLSHPNIAVIYDVGDINGEPYIAMEYIDGTHLGEILMREFPLSLDRVVQIFSQLCTGLEYAHKNGIIHRDIKPANIMLTQDGQVKIVDFGIAKLSSSNLTQTGYILGTPSYMSPELIMGKAIDHRSDIFSVGVMLYETLTSQLPFVGHNPTTIIYKIVHEAHPPVFHQQPTLPSEVEAIVQKALAKNPEQRYQNCSELMVDLKRVQAQPVAPVVASVVAPVAAPVLPTSIDATIVPNTSVPDPGATLFPRSTESRPAAAAPAMQPAPLAAKGEAALPPYPASSGPEIAEGSAFSRGVSFLLRLPTRWLVPIATLAGIVFLFGVWLLVRLTGSSEPLLNPVDGTAPTSSVTMPLLEEAAESSTTLLAPSTTTLVSSGSPTTLATGLKKNTGSGKKSGSPITMVLVDQTTSTLAVTSTLSPAAQARARREEVVVPTPTVPAAAGTKISIPAYHDHWKGGCTGTLTLGERSVVFTPDKGDHNFQSSLATLRKLDMKTERNKARLSLKSEEGRDYNFDITDPQAIQKLTSMYARITRNQ